MTTQNEQDTTTKCTCGSTSFFVTEIDTWNAGIDPATGKLECYMGDSEIDTITCRDCNAEYGPLDFSEVVFP